MRLRRLRERLAFWIAPWVFPLYRVRRMRERERLLRVHLDAHRRILREREAEAVRRAWQR